MSRFVVAFLSVCALAPAAFGQIIYENVRYQHVTASGQTYYYGGTEPRTFYWAELQSELDFTGYNRYRYGAFSGGDRKFGDGLLNQDSPVYSDYFPYHNARRWGFTADDARNQAVRSAPLYFRKRDLLRAAEVQPDGSVVVPSHPRMVVVVDRTRGTDNAGNGATRPTAGKILIIPKPKPAKSDKATVASR
jgi:hypothetical protein